MSSDYQFYNGCFNETVSTLESCHLVVAIPGTINTQPDVLRRVYIGLGGNEHFPTNWSAFNDLLCQLMQNSVDGNVVVVHESLPIVDQVDCRHYLEILCGYLGFYFETDDPVDRQELIAMAPRKNPNLSVFLPECERGLVELMLANPLPNDLPTPPK